MRDSGLKAALTQPGGLRPIIRAVVNQITPPPFRAVFLGQLESGGWQSITEFFHDLSGENDRYEMMQCAARAVADTEQSKPVKSPADRRSAHVHHTQRNDGDDSDEDKTSVPLPVRSPLLGSPAVSAMTLGANPAPRRQHPKPPSLVGLRVGFAVDRILFVSAPSPRSHRRRKP